MKQRVFGRVLTSMIACAGLALLGMGPVAAAQGPGNPGIFPPNADAYGLSYAQWSARWWQWMLALPLAGHPSVVDPNVPFDVTAGQTGDVWFLAGAFLSEGENTVERTCTIPSGKALFISWINVESSSLEVGDFHGDTEEEQRAIADFFADHIPVGSLFCTIDGVPVTNLGDFRFQSPQFTFDAPTPWIFGDVGGIGSSVGDGYFVFVMPLSAGPHTLHFGGAFHFSVADGDDFDADLPIDMTYHLTVRGEVLPPSSYCTAKLNSQGCLPATGWTGSPSLTGADNFHVTASLVRNTSAGIMFWGTAPAAVPFAGGTRCIQGPLIRTSHLNSGGNPYPAQDCSGTYDFHFTHDYMENFFLGAGTTVYAQFWQRDPGHPDGTGQGLTDGLRFTITP